MSDCALRFSSAHKPHSQRVVVGLGSCLGLPPGRQAESKGEAGAPVPSLPAELQQPGCTAGMGLCFHFHLHLPVLCLLLISCALHVSLGLCFFLCLFVSFFFTSVAHALHAHLAEVLTYQPEKGEDLCDLCCCHDLKASFENGIDTSGSIRLYYA